MDVVELGVLAGALRERLEGGVPSKVVFCHNDLQVSARLRAVLSPSHFACVRSFSCQRARDIHPLSILEAPDPFQGDRVYHARNHYLACPRDSPARILPYLSTVNPSRLCRVCCRRPSPSVQLQCGNIMYIGKSIASDELSPENAAAVTPRGDAADSSPVGASPPGVSLIDFEYSGFNPRGFDVGNHFCEWMADYSTAEPHVLDLERYPSPRERRFFCAAYLGATKAVRGVADTTGPSWIAPAKVVVRAFGLLSEKRKRFMFYA